MSGEFVKLKRGALLWMILLGGPLTALMYFSLYLLAGDHYLPIPGENPWTKFLTITYSTFAYVFLPLFIIVIASSSNYMEHRSRTFDYLYTLPIRRGYFFLSKLLLIFLGVLVYLLLLALFIFIAGMILSMINPEFTFQFQTMEWNQVLLYSRHSLVLFMGVMAIQCWVSYRIKNVILPIIIGLASFGIGLVFYFFLAEIKGETTAATLFPYSIPFFKVDMEPSFGVVFYNGIPNIYLFSILFLLLFICLGYFIEERREVS